MAAPAAYRIISERVEHRRIRGRRVFDIGLASPRDIAAALWGRMS
jgi:hypothetical protein